MNPDPSESDYKYITVEEERLAAGTWKHTKPVPEVDIVDEVLLKLQSNLAIAQTELDKYLAE